MNGKLTYLLVALLAMVTQLGRAADVHLDGAPSYSVAKSRITIVAPKISNFSPTNNSGSLRLQAWANPAPFNGGEFQGYSLGAITTGSVPAGGQALNVSNTVAYKAPPNGQYYPTITLEEFSGGQWQLRDYVNLGGATTFSTDAILSMDPPAAWSVSGNGVKLEIAKIGNFAAAGKSGNLRLELWATPAPYAGGGLTDQNGYLLAASGLSPLAAGSSYTNVKRQTSLIMPPDGFFYTTLVLAENVDGNWAQRDFETFPGASYFGGSAAEAMKLDLQGPVSWTLVGRNVKLRAEKIVNKRVGSTSGPLELQLWATTSAYNGGTFDGYVVGTGNVGKIRGGAEAKNINRVGHLTLPPDGEYFTTIALVETTPTGPVVQDFIPLGSTITFDRKSLGGLSGGGTNSGTVAIDIQGRTAFRIVRDTAHFIVGKIVNNRSDVTGPLRLSMYATPERHFEGPIVGTKVSEKNLGRLAVGGAYHDLNLQAPYSKPAAGNYFILFALEENQNGNWVVVDTAAFPRPLTLR